MHPAERSQKKVIWAALDPNHHHTGGVCNCRLHPKKRIYGFWAHKDKSTTTYDVTLDFCPLEHPAPWLEDILEFLPFGDGLDLQRSSIMFTQDLREAQAAVKASRGW